MFLFTTLGSYIYAQQGSRVLTPRKKSIQCHKAIFDLILFVFFVLSGRGCKLIKKETLAISNSNPATLTCLAGVSK